MGQTGTDGVSQGGTCADLGNLAGWMHVTYFVALVITVYPFNMATTLMTFWFQNVPAEMPLHFLGLLLWAAYRRSSIAALQHWNHALCQWPDAVLVACFLPLVVLLYRQFASRSVYRQALQSVGIRTPYLNRMPQCWLDGAAWIPYFGTHLLGNAAYTLHSDIPFATVPKRVGELPRRKPSPPSVWRVLDVSRILTAGLKGAAWLTATVSNCIRPSKGKGKVAQDTMTLKLDVYAPKHPLSRPCPVFFAIHGGGWIVGSKTMANRELLAGLAARGFIVVATSYRLAPNVDLPTIIQHDVRAGLAWVHEHIGAHGGDPSRIIVGGESAGGALALLTTLTQEALAKSDKEKAYPPIIGCVDLCGVTDLTDSGRQYSSRRMDTGAMKKLASIVLRATAKEDPWAHVENSALWWMAGSAARSALSPGSAQAPAMLHGQSWPSPADKPLLHAMAQDSTRPLPPIFILHGPADTIVPYTDSVLVAQQLAARRKREAAGGGAASGSSGGGVLDVFVSLPGAHHAYNYIPSARTQALTDAVTDWCVAVVAAAGGKADAT